MGLPMNRRMCRSGVQESEFVSLKGTISEVGREGNSTKRVKQKMHQ